MSYAPLTLTVGVGPADPPSSRPRSGLRTAHPVHFDAGGADRTTPLRAGLPAGAATVGAALVGQVIEPTDRVNWAVYPRFDETAPPGGGFDATCCAVDLVFDDGSRLSEAGMVDQYGDPATAWGQRDAKTLVVDQWNLRTVDLSPLAGRVIRGVELVAAPDPGGCDDHVTGWIDAVELASASDEAGPTPADRVDTRRGTHSTGAFSRGNTIPAAAWPHGFHFLTPVTDARTTRWLYAYAADDVAPGISSLQAFAISHQPSPWMGDRGILQLMPTVTTAVAPSARAQRFSHADEEAHPYRYSVRFASGITARMAPTDHAAVVEFGYPGGDALIVVDQVTGLGALDVDTGGTRFDGFTDTEGHSQRMWFAAELDRPIIDWAHADAGHTEPGKVAAWLRVEARDGEGVRIRLATSFVGAAQARRNLELETAPTDTVDDVADRARDAWNAKLDAVEVTGASADDQVTLASNLYRVFLYPNHAHENRGSAEHPEWCYADPFAADLDPARFADPLVRPGRLTVNNGFWDTYRTEWSALTLLDPDHVGDLLDGLVEHYRAGGWLARWSAPGYSDAMVGTSSDQIFADAALQGIGGFDVAAAYDSALRNATVPSEDPRTGRKGLAEGIFRGYIPAEITGEAMSWSLENAISDFGLARFSEHLAREASPGDPRSGEYRANASYFANRARGYRLLVDPDTGFFRGRLADGRFTTEPGGFDPRRWGGDYTETNAWGMSVTVPHDAAGLAAVLGGRDELAARLDELFAEPETAADTWRGAYPTVIHEMVEARALRMGMFGLSNQPAHHIPFLYLAAGRPDRTQEITGEALARLFTGSDVGQGYPGDEDNGELSAWWLFAALGLYPLALGSGGFVVTTPLFPRVTVRLGGGRSLEIVARGADAGQRYIRSLTVDGRPWSSTFLPFETLLDGARLDFDLAAEPCAWGSRPEDEPPSLGGVLVADVASAGRTSHRELVDDSSACGIRLDAPWTLDLAEPATLGAYTLTAGPALASWTLEGSVDGDSWAVLDDRANERFRWERQTRPFLLAHADPIAHLRLTVRGAPILYQVEVFPAA